MKIFRSNVEENKPQLSDNHLLSFLNNEFQMLLYFHGFVSTPPESTDMGYDDYKDDELSYEDDELSCEDDENDSD